MRGSPTARRHRLQLSVVNSRAVTHARLPLKKLHTHSHMQHCPSRSFTPIHTCNTAPQEASHPLTHATLPLKKLHTHSHMQHCSSRSFTPTHACKTAPQESFTPTNTCNTAPQEASHPLTHARLPLKKASHPLTLATLLLKKASHPLTPSTRTRPSVRSPSRIMLHISAYSSFLGAVGTHTLQRGAATMTSFSKMRLLFV